MPSAFVTKFGVPGAGVGLRTARCAGSSGGGGLVLRAGVVAVDVVADVAVTVVGGSLGLAAMIVAVAGGW